MGPMEIHRERVEIAHEDRDIDIVDRLRLGGPNAMEVVDQAADEIERLRRKNEHLLAIINGISRQTAEAVKANS